MADFAPADDVAEEQEEVSSEEFEADASTDEHTDTDEEAGETVELAYLGEGDDSERDLVEGVEANAKELTFRATEYRVDEQQETIDELQEENRELQEQIDALEERLKSLEGWRSNTVSRVNGNIGDINRLMAAIFGHETPCPECEDGHLEADIGGWGDDQISCSACEYEQELE